MERRWLMENMTEILVFGAAFGAVWGVGFGLAWSIVHRIMDKRKLRG